MRLIFQIKFSSVARPSDYSTSPDTRHLAIIFRELDVLDTTTQEELSSYKFNERSTDRKIHHLYGMGEVEGGGVWSTAPKSAFMIDISDPHQSFLFTLKYGLLERFADGIDASISINEGDETPLRLDGNDLRFTMQAGSAVFEGASHPDRGIPVPRQDAIVVLGMHRSGTSALTRMLSLAGANLPLNLMPSMPDNPTGFWESRRIAMANDLILGSVGSRWDDPVASVIDDTVKMLTLPGLVDLIGDEFDHDGLIVLKDPRISLIVDLWDQALRRAGYRVHYVTAMRHPLDVANSLRKRNTMPTDYAVLLWTRYVLAILDSAAKSKFVDFNDIMARPVALLHELAGTIGPIQSEDVDRATEAVVAFVNPDYNHGTATDVSADETLKPAIDLYTAITRHGNNVDMYESEMDVRERGSTIMLGFSGMA